MSLPAQLVALRQRRGWRQIDLARDLGVSPRTVEAWETGTAQPRKGPALVKLLKRLNERQPGYLLSVWEAMPLGRP